MDYSGEFLEFNLKIVRQAPVHVNKMKKIPHVANVADKNVKIPIKFLKYGINDGCICQPK